MPDPHPGLFDELPSFDVPLPQDELKLLRELPDYGENQCVGEVAWEDEPACRRLAARGLVKFHRWKDDPAGIGTTMYAGRLRDPLQSTTLERPA